MKNLITLAFASIFALSTFGQDIIEITYDGFKEAPLSYFAQQTAKVLKMLSLG